MLLKNRILIATLFALSLLTVLSFIFGHFDVMGLGGMVFVFALASSWVYYYIQKQCEPFYNALAKFPDFSKKPDDISDVSYLDSSIKKLLEPANEDPEDKARQNKLIISNEILSHLNDTITEMVDSLGQGFLTFDMEGRCGNIYSKRCIDLLGLDPAGKSIFEVLSIPSEEHEQINDLMEMIFMPPSHAIPVDDFLSFFPQEVRLSNGLTVKLDYKGITGKGGYVKKIVMIATDRTFEIEAQKMVNAEKHKAKSIIKINQRRKDFIVFVNELRAVIKSLKSTLLIFSESPKKINITKLKLDLHTLKGVAGVFGLLDLVDIIHNIENKLEYSEVNYNELGRELENEMEVILSWARLLLGNNFEQAAEMRQIKVDTIKEFYKDLNDNNANDALREEFVENFIAIPVIDIINGFDSQILDVSMDLNKKIAPIESESNVKSIIMDEYNSMFSSFTHIFNNIIDHGIEFPEKRKELGKESIGRIKMGIFVDKNPNSKDALRITIEDDGGGINPEVIRKKLKEADPEGDWVNESDEQIIQRIFHFGFSTKQEISKLSGRGVGMDAVRDEVAKLGGTIHVESKVGVGTKFTILVG